MVPWFYQQGFPPHSLQGNSKQLLTMNKCRNVNTIKKTSVLHIFFQELFDEEQRKLYNLDQARSIIAFPQISGTRITFFHLISDFMSIALWFHVCIWFLLRILCHCFVEISSILRCWREMINPLPEVREAPEVYLDAFWCKSSNLEGLIILCFIFPLNFYVSLAEGESAM